MFICYSFRKGVDVRSGIDTLVFPNGQGDRKSDIARGLPQVPVGEFSRAIQVISYVMSALSTLVKDDMLYFKVIYFVSLVLTKLAIDIMIMRFSST
ncbi:integral membrane protein [Colletotrichum incanum]|uniref:Integral membrane protein n=1 Tax=Colletotrichum incanum TaxID=1573173 RepID=A0A167BEI6_COLIC|nr:integral membrane protein [Colletotrichum incanum]